MPAIEANLTMTHADIISRSLTPFAYGSSARVFDAVVRLGPGQEAEHVALKERLQGSTEAADKRVRPCLCVLVSREPHVMPCVRPQANGNH